MTVHSAYYCPRCYGGGDLILSNNGEKEYFDTGNTNKYHCLLCKSYFKIKESKNDY